MDRINSPAANPTNGRERSPRPAGLLLTLALLLLAPLGAQPPMGIDGTSVAPAVPLAPMGTTGGPATLQASPPPADGLTNPTAASEAFNRRTTDAVIQYDPDTDSIIVITDEATNSQINRVIQTMDRPVPQVLIKVLFLEVTHSRDLDLGVESSLNWNENADGTFRDSVGTNFFLTDAAAGGFYRYLSDDLQATLRALARIGKTNVLSRPSIMTRNNQTATITVGQEIPFIINSRVTDEGQTINTIRYDDIGIILQVTPRITQDRSVQMDVAPEISNLTADTVPISDTVDAQVIALRSAETSVVVGDGRTVVIGGLMQDNENEEVTKVPILGDIPLLGFFFRRTVTNKVKTELLIFLTPYVVEGPEQLDALSVHEHNQAEVPPVEFTPQQQEKFIENIGPGNIPWTGEK